MEKFSEGKMSCVEFETEQDEMAALLARIAGPVGSYPERIARAARALGWNYRRAKAHWYREARRIDNHEMRAAREAAARAEEASTNAEIAKLQARLARLEALLGARPDQNR
jgi:hypothetical protein